MPQLITIENIQLEQLFYDGKPVVTFQQIAEVHGITVQNVHSAFRRHKDRFVEGKHFYLVENEGIRLEHNGTLKTNYLFTEKGYLLLTKPLRDTKAWEVQERMVDDYFALRTTGSTHSSAVDRFPELKAIMELVQSTAEARILAEEAQAMAHAAEVRAARAEGKADMALEHAHRMTIEEFISKNGLLGKWPYETHASIAKWLQRFCEAYGLPTWKVEVYGKRWKEELAYPLQACAAWLRKELQSPHQLRIVPVPPAEEVPAHGVSH